MRCCLAAKYAETTQHEALKVHKKQCLVRSTWWLGFKNNGSFAQRIHMSVHQPSLAGAYPELLFLVRYEMLDSVYQGEFEEAPHVG